jgi:hypothetical protein
LADDDVGHDDSDKMVDFAAHPAEIDHLGNRLQGGAEVAKPSTKLSGM